MTTQIVENLELFSEAQLEALEFLPEELENIESELYPNLESISLEEVAKDLEAYFEGGVEQAGLEARGPGGARGGTRGGTRGGIRSRIRGRTRGSARGGGSPSRSRRVGEEWRELARDMAANPAGYGRFANLEGKLPKVKDPAHYIEGTVETGTATGRGQYRVVCLVEKVHRKFGVTKKYWTRTHYGTGSDAGKEPAFQEFR